MLDDFDRPPPTPFPRLGMENPDRRRVTHPAGSIGHGREGAGGSVDGKKLPTSDTTTAQSDVHLSSKGREPTVDGDISEQGSEPSSGTGVVRFPRRWGLWGANLNRSLSDVKMARNWGEPERRRDLLNLEAAGLGACLGPIRVTN